MNYKQKYLKYKLKYLHIKNLYGGGMEATPHQNIIPHKNIISASFFNHDSIKMLIDKIINTDKVTPIICFINGHGYTKRVGSKQYVPHKILYLYPNMPIKTTTSFTEELIEYVAQHINTNLIDLANTLIVTLKAFARTKSELWDKKLARWKLDYDSLEFLVCYNLANNKYTIENFTQLQITFKDKDDGISIIGKKDNKIYRYDLRLEGTTSKEKEYSVDLKKITEEFGEEFSKKCIFVPLVCTDNKGITPEEEEVFKLERLIEQLKQQIEQLETQIKQTTYNEELENELVELVKRLDELEKNKLVNARGAAWETSPDTLPSRKVGTNNSSELSPTESTIPPLVILPPPVEKMPEKMPLFNSTGSSTTIQEPMDSPVSRVIPNP